MQQKYFYQLYNLTISSNVELIDLNKINLDTNHDIVVFSKQIDNEDELNINSHYIFNFEKDKFNMIIKDIAKYSIYNGKLVNIEYSKSSTLDEINLYLLGSCLGVLLYQRDYLPLHSSSIETTNGCVFFSGVSGMGKSTTLKSFLKKGYKMISDDLVALSFENQQIHIYPSFPRVKLWEDSANKLDIDISNLNKIHRDMNKYSKPIENEIFSNEISKPYIFYEINFTDKNDIYIEDVKGVEKINTLLKNTYRPRYITYLNKNKEHFKQISLLANKLIVKKVYRPKEINTINEFTNILEKDFTQ